MTTKEQLHAEFDERFGDLTLGILSGEKGSPVFVNNELEKPRLMNFLDQAYDRIREEALGEVLSLLKEHYPDILSRTVDNLYWSKTLYEAIQSLITKK